ncbi:DUF167 domain-containing protein [Svornostia abyssi]|uniref:UPF0235 protein LRS13_17200 n=1 Tax=Svornostia abyssi TaxID=2898438 RepID=A0ABY5PCM7_9ACTN|nr:DUF167 domain-containing protein [Parviterribacteraceae bacterium J379]
MARIAVRLQPRARRDEVVGMRGDAIVICVTAPPVDGRANAALCAFVAKRTGVPKSAVSVVVGAARARQGRRGGGRRRGDAPQRAHRFGLTRNAPRMKGCTRQK